MRGEGTIGANDAPRGIVNDDVIADGVNVFYPLFLGTFELREAANLFHDQRGVAGQGIEQFVFAGGEVGFAARQAQRAHQFLVAGVDRIEGARQASVGTGQDFEAGPRTQDIFFKPAWVNTIGGRNRTLLVELHAVSEDFANRAPIGLQKFAGALGESGEEGGQLAAMGRFDGEIHELARDKVGGTRRTLRAERARGPRGRESLLITHRAARDVAGVSK